MSIFYLCKMKSFVLLCVVLVTGTQAGYVTLSPAQNEEANNNAYACLQEFGVTSEPLAVGRKGNILDDESIKKLTHCFFKKADIVTSDGKLNIDVALAKLPPGIDKGDAKQLLEHCKSKTGKDATDTVYEIFKCYVFGTKVHIKMDFEI